MAAPIEHSSPLAEMLKQRLSPKDLAGITRLARTAKLPESEAERPNEQPEGSYDGFVSSLLPSLLDRRDVLAHQKAKAPALLEELLGHPPERRQVLVRNSARFLNRPLCEMLQEQSLDACFRRPSEAVALAELAVEISERIPRGSVGEAVAYDLRARSLGFLANAYRVNTEPNLAGECLDKAELLLDEGGSGDLLELAWLTSLRGALRGNQRRLEESLQLFDQAIRIYRQCGEPHLLGRTIIYKATYHGHTGDSESAIRMLSEGLDLVDCKREPRLALIANHNLIYYLTDLGRHAEAAELLESSRHLYHELGDRISLMRLRWLEARMARERNALREAEEAFAETREAFIAERMTWDVALVSLELAAVYLEQGRSAEIQSLADELVPIFQATGMHREAVASLILFHKAAELEKVTAELIRRTMAQLQSLRRDR